MKPIHCGKPAKVYREVYREAFFYRDNHGKRALMPCSYEMGFKCVVCGQLRVPDESKPFDRSDMDKMDAIREAGIEFDKQLGTNYA